MRRMKAWLIGLLTGIGCLSSFAHDFTATVNGQKIYFRITNQAASAAEVTYKGSMADHPVCEVKGDIEIPAKVRHDNVIYKVTAIGPKAFSGARELTGIVLPSSLTKIGDFAFEGCTSLSKVVFPGNAVTFGQGTFFKCKKLKDLSFGSDWKTLDLTPYRWSDSLQAITIPAKVEKVQNLKILKSLQRVETDANNLRFLSAGGVLYGKDGKTLYGVPRRYQGKLNVRAGTEAIMQGALIDCLEITRLVFPESLKTLSFRETSRMSSLAEVVFKSTDPVRTAYTSGRGVFLLQVANPHVKIVVPKEARKLYVEQLVVTPGEYFETSLPANPSYQVTGHQLPGVKNISGVKKFDKYE